MMNYKAHVWSNSMYSATVGGTTDKWNSPWKIQVNLYYVCVCRMLTSCFKRDKHFPSEGKKICWKGDNDDDDNVWKQITLDTWTGKWNKNSENSRNSDKKKCLTTHSIVERVCNRKAVI